MDKLLSIYDPYPVNNLRPGIFWRFFIAIIPDRFRNTQTIAKLIDIARHRRTTTNNFEHGRYIRSSKYFTSNYYYYVLPQNFFLKHFSHVK